MTTTQQTPAIEILELRQRVQQARTKAASWITDRIADDGTPAGAQTANSWWRAPWALCLAGEPAAAAALMGWAERNALTDTGDLRPGPYGGGPYTGGTSGTPTYLLSPLAIASWLLARYDTAEAVMATLETYRDPRTGGAYEYANHTQDPLQDMLKTCQLGISALVTGHREIADGVHGWLVNNYAQQPSLPEALFTSSRGGDLVTDFPAEQSFIRRVDYTAPRQAYFQSGIAGAFLAGYYQQTQNMSALELGKNYLRLNQNGTEAQFDDPSSIQICKFGWGAAAMHTADPGPDSFAWVVRMGEWFVDRQEQNGAWAPSSFAVPQPGELDYFWKTAEHLMELSYIELALAATS
ncbi:hypothetical protein [Arthrobacter sp. W4I7]|uniref:hypothetical protein n=1 Tax=Arthrobacter sp. W4I7 TaxID=3042296 RepID=UPI0027871321|nr:hypothetical protein [Arthrobacter sp. W4I7]MDQ0691441.1 hypothetical protein [Arthrobacter sp. W4I7]